MLSGSCGDVIAEAPLRRFFTKLQISLVYSCKHQEDIFMSQNIDTIRELNASELDEVGGGLGVGLGVALNVDASQELGAVSGLVGQVGGLVGGLVGGVLGTVGGVAGGVTGGASGGVKVG